jgi:hypothetical protein
MRAARARARVRERCEGGATLAARGGGANAKWRLGSRARGAGRGRRALKMALWLAAVVAAATLLASPVRADFVCSGVMMAQFHSMFVAQTMWTQARDTCSLCELCQKIVRDMIMYSNDDATARDWQQVTRDNACTYTERDRAGDCRLLTSEILRLEAPYFESGRAKLKPHELATTSTRAAAIYTRAYAFCRQVFCCSLVDAPPTEKAGAEDRKGGGESQGSLAPSGGTTTTIQVQSGGSGTNVAISVQPLPDNHIYSNRTTDEMVSKMVQDRKALDDEKASFDQKKGYLDNYREQLRADEQEVKRLRADVANREKLILSGVLKEHMEKKVAAIEAEKELEAAKRKKIEEEEKADAEEEKDDEQEAKESKTGDEYVDERNKRHRAERKKRREQRAEARKAARKEMEKAEDERKKAYDAARLVGNGTQPTPVNGSASGAAGSGAAATATLASTGSSSHGSGGNAKFRRSDDDGPRSHRYKRHGDDEEEDDDREEDDSVRYARDEDRDEDEERDEEEEEQDHENRREREAHRRR